MKKNIAILLLLLSCVGVRAGIIGLYDDSFTVVGLDTGLIAARWGTYSDGVFTQLLGGAYDAVGNAGYVDLESPELTANLTQGDNANIAPGAFLALAIINIGAAADYSSVAPQVILTDVSWVATVFSPSGGDAGYSFTSNTVAQVGGFTYSAGGFDSITLSTVPEPAAYAGLVGVAALGVVAWRRRRAA